MSAVASTEDANEIHSWGHISHRSESGTIHFSNSSSSASSSSSERPLDVLQQAFRDSPDNGKQLLEAAKMGTRHHLISVLSNTPLDELLALQKADQLKKVARLYRKRDRELLFAVIHHVRQQQSQALQLLGDMCEVPKLASQCQYHTIKHVASLSEPQLAKLLGVSQVSPKLLKVLTYLRTVSNPSAKPEDPTPTKEPERYAYSHTAPQRQRKPRRTFSLSNFDAVMDVPAMDEDSSATSSAGKDTPVKPKGSGRALRHRSRTMPSVKARRPNSSSKAKAADKARAALARKLEKDVARGSAASSSATKSEPVTIAAKIKAEKAKVAAATPTPAQDNPPAQVNGSEAKQPNGHAPDAGSRSVPTAESKSVVSAASAPASAAAAPVPTIISLLKPTESMRQFLDANRVDDSMLPLLQPTDFPAASPSRKAKGRRAGRKSTASQDEQFKTRWHEIRDKYVQRNQDCPLAPLLRVMQLDAWAGSLKGYTLHDLMTMDELQLKSLVPPLGPRRRLSTLQQYLRQAVQPTQSQDVHASTAGRVDFVRKWVDAMDLEPQQRVEFWNSVHEHGVDDLVLPLLVEEDLAALCNGNAELAAISLASRKKVLGRKHDASRNSVVSLVVNALGGDSSTLGNDESKAKSVGVSVSSFTLKPVEEVGTAVKGVGRRRKLLHLHQLLTTEVERARQQAVKSAKAEWEAKNQQGNMDEHVAAIVKRTTQGVTTSLNSALSKLTQELEAALAARNDDLLGHLRVKLSEHQHESAMQHAKDVRSTLTMQLNDLKTRITTMEHSTDSAGTGDDSNTSDDVKRALHEQAEHFHEQLSHISETMDGMMESQDKEHKALEEAFLEIERLRKDNLRLSQNLREALDNSSKGASSGDSKAPAQAVPAANQPLKLVYGHLEFPLDSTLKIGRNKQNDIQIADPLVSGNHCIIRAGGRLMDKQSTNGTLINDQEVAKGEYHTLKEGDVVAIGDSRLKVAVGVPYNGTPLPASSGASSGQDAGGSAAVGRLRQEIANLRAENLKLKVQVNPAHKRKDRDRQTAKIRDLQFQLYYGVEKEEDMVAELKEELAATKAKLEAYEAASTAMAEAMGDRQQSIRDMLDKHATDPEPQADSDQSDEEEPVVNIDKLASAFSSADIADLTRADAEDDEDRMEELKNQSIKAGGRGMLVTPDMYADMFRANSKDGSSFTGGDDEDDGDDSDDWLDSDDDDEDAAATQQSDASASASAGADAAAAAATLPSSVLEKALAVGAEDAASAALKDAESLLASSTLRRGDMATSLVLDVKGTEYVLRPGFNLTIGRSKANDIQLQDMMVSSSHCTINGLTVTDKGSTNGTLINGQEMTTDQVYALQAGDVLTCGDTQLTIKSPEADSDATQPAAAATDDNADKDTSTDTASEEQTDAGKNGSDDNEEDNENKEEDEDVEWTKHRDAKTGVSYYYHVPTGKSQWTKPEDWSGSDTESSSSGSGSDSDSDSSDHDAIGAPGGLDVIPE